MHAALKELIADRSRLLVVAHAAQQRALRHNTRTMAAAYVGLYRQLIEASAELGSHVHVTEEIGITLGNQQRLLILPCPCLWDRNAKARCKPLANCIDEVALDGNIAKPLVQRKPHEVRAVLSFASVSLESWQRTISMWYVQ